MDIQKECAELNRMKVGELRERYAEVFGESTRSNNKVWLVKKIAWKLQANEEGGLSERAQKRAEELAKSSEIRVTVPREKKARVTKESGQKNGAASEKQDGASEKKYGAAPQEKAKDHQRDPRLPKVGSTLFRPYKGRVLEVKILEDGFEYEGQKYKSLSALAVKITGSHCSGFLFFKPALEGARDNGK